jgi:hypothetical protein
LIQLNEHFRGIIPPKRIQRKRYKQSEETHSTGKDRGILIEK